MPSYISSGVVCCAVSAWQIIHPRVLQCLAKSSYVLRHLLEGGVSVCVCAHVCVNSNSKIC
jgi:hypothetical protein